MILVRAEDIRGSSDVESTAKELVHEKCTCLRWENVVRCNTASKICHSSASKICSGSSPSCVAKCVLNTTTSNCAEDMCDRIRVIHGRPALGKSRQTANAIKRNRERDVRSIE